MDIEFYIFLMVGGIFGLALSINDLKSPKKKAEHVAYRTNYFILFFWSSICILIALVYFMKSYLT